MAPFMTSSPAESREAGRLPDFLLIGAAKAGTTALFAALARHPCVYASQTKEPRFLAYADAVPSFKGPGGAKYASTIVTDAASYRSLFAGCPENARAGEASTDYLCSEAAPHVARRLVPQARIVAILRHPVERAYSQFLHLRQHGHEPVPDFEAAWMDESRRAAAGWRPSHLYQRRGFYGQQLTRWLGHFPREQLLILFYEDWCERPAELLALAWRHIGLQPLTDPAVERENVSSRQPRWKWLHQLMVGDNRLRQQRWLPLGARKAITRTILRVNTRYGPALDPAVRARLATAYLDDLRMVEGLTGRDLGAWRT